MAAKTLPSRALLRELLHYNPENGEFTWLPRPETMFHSRPQFLTWNKRFAHTVAGVTSRYRNGYRRRSIAIYEAKYFAHRLAWMWMYGTEPEEIDHIDGDPLNNRIANLRSVTRGEQLRNTRTRVKNSSGIKGVCWDKSKRKWLAKVQLKGLTIHIGRFDAIEDAAKARRVAAIRLHGEFARHK